MSESDSPQTVEMPQAVAWAAVGKNGEPMWLSYNRQDAECAVVGMADVVPLYRAPTLTDAEREAIGLSIPAMQYAADELGLSRAEFDRHAATLRGLLERTR